MTSSIRLARRNTTSCPVFPYPATLAELYDDITCDPQRPLRFALKDWENAKVEIDYCPFHAEASGERDDWMEGEEDRLGKKTVAKRKRQMKKKKMCPPTRTLGDLIKNGRRISIGGMGVSWSGRDSHLRDALSRQIEETFKRMR